MNGQPEQHMLAADGSRVVVAQPTAGTTLTFDPLLGLPDLVWPHGPILTGEIRDGAVSLVKGYGTSILLLSGDGDMNSWVKISGPAAKDPAWLRILGHLSVAMPRPDRDRVFEPSFEELRQDFYTRMAEPGLARWEKCLLAFGLAVRTVLLVLLSIRTVYLSYMAGWLPPALRQKMGIRDS